MADKISQVEDFCTHTKILGGYLIRPDNIDISVLQSKENT